MSCSIDVIAFYFGDGYSPAGSFYFTANDTEYENGETMSMASANPITNEAASSYAVFITSGPVGAQVFIDNVVTIQFC